MAHEDRGSRCRAPLRWRGMAECITRLVNPTGPMNLFSELKRRNVYKVAAAYAALAWLLAAVGCHRQESAARHGAKEGP